MSRYNDHERVLRDIMKNPDASPDARAKAALAVDRMKQRRALAKRKAAEAAQPEEPAPRPEMTPEDKADLLAELDRRGLGNGPIARAKRQAVYDAWKARRDILKARGITQPDWEEYFRQNPNGPPPEEDVML